MRGDYALTFSRSLTLVGPSPRVWGLRRSRPGAPGTGRSIPTCVGTTGALWWRSPHSTGHPHVRGDYHSPRRRVMSSCGPSPRAWGLLAAAAGQAGIPGPSPRAWGLPVGLADPNVPLRAIPTCVGTTPTRRFSPPPRTGHPHVRGDYEVRVQRGVKVYGPSPRAWGLRKLNPYPFARTRAIPTCVGTTLDQDGENARSPPVMCLFGRSSGKRFSSSAAPGEGVRVGRLVHLTTRASRARRAMLRAMRAKAMRA